MNWEAIGIRRHDDHAARFTYRPFGEADYVELPAPIDVFMVGPRGVTFQCGNGGLYHLTSDTVPSDVMHWRIRLVAIV